ncbi:MAG: response regulator [Deltaproteobacteria bacterium]|nr:response regulator [Deltaproteobacteria bacterium]
MRVLLVHDSADDALVVANALLDYATGVSVERVTDETDLRRALRDVEFDVVISDWKLRAIDALRALEVLAELHPSPPLVIVADAADEHTAAAAMRAGARDFVPLDRLGRLLPVVEREVREHLDRMARVEAEQALERSEHRYRRLVETTTHGVWVLDAEGKTTFVNARMASMLRVRAEDLIGASPGDYMREWREANPVDMLTRFLGGASQQTEIVYRRADGTTFVASVEGTPIVDRNGNFEGGIALVTDISERREAERALEERDAEIHQRLRCEALLGDVGLALTDGTSLRDTLTRCVRALVTHADATLARLWIFDSTRSALELVASAGPQERVDATHPRAPLGLGAVEKIAQTGRPHVSDDFPSDPSAVDPAFLRQNRIVGFAGQPLVVRGEVLGVVAMFAPQGFRALTLKAFHNIASAIALGVRQKIEEEAKLEAEAQLRHSQKMEAIGRLAGGIAHDFNNLLSVITNYAKFIEEEAAPGGQIAADAHEIVLASQRAAALTRQLLLFSRRQVRETRLIDLDELVLSMDRMVRRLVGEDVTVVVETGVGGDFVRGDSGGLEQVLMNLVVNARDAMPKGGHVTIRTSSFEIDRSRASELGLQPGRHAVLSVADTGTGIDAETRQRIFEPYFTTKEVTKGTGLGLSMVRGIVQESGGIVTVDTEVGRGTTFAVYLPCVVDGYHAAHVSIAPPRSAPPATILLVEDEPFVRATARRLLERKGYRVHEAESGEDAIAIVRRADRPFDLLITDVVMPGMSGPSLARQLVEMQPSLRVVIMSGYSEDSLAHHGSTHETRAWLKKPFTLESLTTAVRNALE